MPLVPVGWIDLAIVAAFLVAMLAVGAWAGRRLGGLDDFLLAGRAVTAPILVCTLVSTFYGVDVLFGTSELAFEEGVVAWFTYSRPMYLFLLVAAFVLAARLRDRGYRTLPDVLAAHYGRPTQILGASASFVYALPSLGLFGLGRTFHVLFGWEPWVGALVFGGVALLYTLAGGLLADVLTDTVQFAMMALTLAIAIPLLLLEVGGFGALEASLGPDHFAPLGTLPPWLAIVYASTGLVVFVEPTFYQRIFAARSTRDVRVALLAGIFFWAAYDWCVTAGGMLAAGAVAAGSLPADLHPNDALLVAVVSVLPAGLVGFFLAGVLATEMSTIDSYCLVAGGNVAYDVVRPLATREIPERRLLALTRAGIVLSWVLGFAVAFAFESLLGLWVFLATVLVGTLLVPILAALFLPSWAKPAAGLLASGLGLATSLGLYAAVGLLGAWSEEWGTYVWELPGGLALWHEHTLLVAVPVSMAGFAAGAALGRRPAGPGRGAA